MDDQNEGYSSATSDLSRLSQMMDCSFLMNGDTNGVIYRLGTSDSEVCCVVCALCMLVCRSEMAGEHGRDRQAGRQTDRQTGRPKK